jgi:hypothetical protein
MIHWVKACLCISASRDKGRIEVAVALLRSDLAWAIDRSFFLPLSGGGQ